MNISLSKILFLAFILFFDELVEKYRNKNKGGNSSNYHRFIRHFEKKIICRVPKVQKDYLNKIKKLE